MATTTRTFCYKCILVFGAFLFLLKGSAQEDRFTDYSQLNGQEVVLYNLSSIFLTNGKFMFIEENGKLKPIKPEEIINKNKCLRLTHVENVTIKKKNYLHLKSADSMHIYMLVDKKKQSYISNFKNVTYWSNKFKLLTKDASYLYIPSYDIPCETDKYKKITWLGVKMPESSIDDTVGFEYIYLYENKQEENCIGFTIDDIQGLITILPSNPNSQSFGFRSQANYEAAAEKEELAEKERCRRDSIPLVAVCKEEYKFGEDTFDHTYEGDTAYVYWADEDYMKMMYKYITIKGYYKYFTVEDSDQLSFLKERGTKNIELRTKIATQLAAEYFDRDNKRIDVIIEKLLAEDKANIKKAKTNKLFLEDWEYSYGDYGDCGLKFTIFNCFNKTIKYVEFTCTPYNVVNDIQPDYVGRRSSTRKGIGPVEPEDKGVWDFDNMFYDRNDIIDRIELTNIKFIFSDNTTITYTGKANIKKHIKKQ